MKDRISLYPGRVMLTPVAGQENVYDMVRADEPQEAGTPLNKAHLLTDDTATMLGLDPETATPNDALAKLLENIVEINGSVPQIITGTYTGNLAAGTDCSTSSSAKTLSFLGIPQLLIIIKPHDEQGYVYGARGFLVFIKDAPAFTGVNIPNQGMCEWGQNYVKWWLKRSSANYNSPDSMANLKGYTYKYIAFLR